MLDQITVIDFNPVVFRTLADRGLHVVYGDISNVDTLLHAGVGKSELIILSIPDSLLKGANNEKLVRHVRSLNPTAKIVATADLLSDVNDLYAAGADYVTVTRLSDAHELYKVIEAAQAGLLEDTSARRTRIALLAERACCEAAPRALRNWAPFERALQTALLRHRIGKGGAAAGDEAGDQDRRHQQPHRDRDRAFDINPEIALAEEQRLAKMLFDVGAEDQADHQWRELEFHLVEGVADDAGGEQHPDVENAVADAVGADDGQHQQQRNEQVMRNPQQADPDADHRDVQRQQHDIADIGRRDQAPENFRVLGDQQRPGLDALHQHRRDHQCGDRREGNAECEQRHQRGGGGGIIGGFGPGDAFDRAAADFAAYFDVAFSSR